MEKERNRIRCKEISLLTDGHIITAKYDKREESIYIIIEKNNVYTKRYLY